MIFQSVRARLALWHTAVLAVLLIGFALAAYIFLDRTTAARADEYLASAAAGFVTELTAERIDANSDSAAIDAAASEFRVRDLGVLIFDHEGRRIAAGSGGLLSGPPPPVRHRQTGAEPEPVLDTARLREAVMQSAPTNERKLMLPDAEGGYWVSLIPVQLRNGVYRVAMVQSRHAEEETLEAARLACIIAIPIMLLAAGVGGSFLAKRSLAPVAALSERAARISATDLSERLPVRNPRDELGQLAVVLNELLSRVDHSLEQQRRFMADASHELRTPVSIMRAEAEVSLSADARTPTEYRDSLRVIVDTSARLSVVVNELFFLARADAGQQPLRRSALYLDELLSDCVRSLRALAERSGVIILPVLDEDASFNGDDGMLRRLVTNLLDNAVKYSGSGSTITVTLSEAPDAYSISIRDSGAGIPPEAQPHLFERFFRADVARSRAASGSGSMGGGAGLGLAIAQWVAEAHGGRLTLASSSPAGTEFVLWLPRDIPAPVESPSEFPYDSARSTPG
ncbi:MAG: ATP-binding protein [Gemmatimonadaceae bacterium]